MVMFTRLLESYPHSQPRIVMEAVVDVCPLVRAEVWAALLGVKVRDGAGERGRGRCVQGEGWCRGEREREVCAG